MEFENVLFFLNKLGCGSELAQKLKPWLESLKAFQAQQGYQQPTVLDSHFIYKFKTFICFFFFLHGAARRSCRVIHILAFGT